MLISLKKLARWRSRLEDLSFPPNLRMVDNLSRIPKEILDILGSRHERPTSGS